jgi:sigma-E factor negative regulatory protein RseA
MTKELSALLDGELEPHEAQRLWSDMKANSHLHALWDDCHLIGAVLRREEPVAVDMRSRVMTSLAEEPVVLAPRPARRQGWQGSLVALAASVAGVAVVGWLALAQQNPSSERATMARLENARPTTVAVPPQDVSEYQEYLLAHQTNAPGLHMQGGAQHIRTVSAAVGAR